ncbi:MAG: fatty acid cis/trans isomerase, partial [Methylovulum sp.]
IPTKARTELYGSWYQGIDFKVFSDFRTPTFDTDKEPAISYQTADIKNEFFEKIQQQLEPSLAKADLINRCLQEPCIHADSSPEQQQVDNIMRQLAALKGDAIKALPEVSFIRIKTANPAKDPVYTLIRNKKLLNVSFVFAEKLRREPEKDTLTVIPGFLGSYPNQFFGVPVQQLQDFVEQLKHVKTDSESERFYSSFAIRRNNPEIWRYFDWFNQKYRDEQPENAGLFDMSRYENF